jgi:ABC-2 type transport system permease protein
MSGDRIRSIVKKEFRQVFRDRGSLAVLTIVPLFLLAMFGYAISMDIKHVPLAVLDRDRSAQSREFLGSFLRSDYFNLVARLSDEGEIDGVLDGGEALVVLVIPRGFAADVLSGTAAQVQVVVDGANGNTASTAIGYVQGITAEYSGTLLLRTLERTGASGPGGLVDFRPRILFNPELRSANFLVPGLIVLILVMSSVMSTSLSIVREKERGTMEQLLVSPIRPIELIIGKTIPYILIALVSATAILFASGIFFGVTVRGSWLNLFLVTLLFLGGCLGLGVLISSIAESQQVAFLVSVLLTLLPSYLLSGFVFPIRNMPVPVQFVTYLLPTRYYLAALRAIMLKGAGVSAYWDQILGLAGFAAVTIALSVARLKGDKL